MEATDPELYNFLASFISPHKQQLFDEKIQNRTRHIAILLEDIFQAQNASAVVRTADCYGVQDVFIIEEKYPYKLNLDVLKGSSRWVDLHRYKIGDQALGEVRDRGYKIAATTPTGKIPIAELPLNERVMLAFGSEITGLSKKIMDVADYHVRIPMFGFTESFNISVSAAIALYDTISRLHRSGIDWQLSAAVQQSVKYHWMRRIIKNASGIEAVFYQKKQRR